MLIEQIMKFQSKGPGLPGSSYTPITGSFHDKTKTCKQNLRLAYYLRLKYCRSNAAMYIPHLSQITDKI